MVQLDRTHKYLNNERVHIYVYSIIHAYQWKQKHTKLIKYENRNELAFAFNGILFSAAIKWNWMLKELFSVQCSLTIKCHSQMHSCWIIILFNRNHSNFIPSFQLYGDATCIAVQIAIGLVSMNRIKRQLNSIAELRIIEKINYNICSTLFGLSWRFPHLIGIEMMPSRPISEWKCFNECE